MSKEITFDDIEFGEPIEEREPTYREGYIRGIYRAKNIIDSKQKEIERLNNIINELSKENQELKKQLENKYEKVGTLTSELLYEENTKLINQQKEFIEYLEDEIKLREEINDIVLATGFEEILQNYKEIIGDVKNEKENIKEISKRFKFKEILDKAVNDMQGTNLYYSKEFVDDIISKLKEKDKEIERLNNIINELKKENSRLRKKIKELKGEDKE